MHSDGEVAPEAPTFLPDWTVSADGAAEPTTNPSAPGVDLDHNDVATDPAQVDTQRRQSDDDRLRVDAHREAVAHAEGDRLRAAAGENPGAQAEAELLLAAAIDDAERFAAETAAEAQADAQEIRAKAAIDADRIRAAAAAEAVAGVQAEAEKIRAAATEEAERIRVEAAADALRLRGDAGDAALRLDTETRAQAAKIAADAASEAERLREDAERVLNAANARAREILDQAEADVRKSREAAAVTASRIREQAEAERQRLLHEARTLAETESARVIADAVAEAERTTAAASADARQIREHAELEAQTARETADLDRLRIVEEARAQAYFEAVHIREEGARQARSVMLRVPPTTTPIHSSEITLREFPHALRGYDPEAVSKWLYLVEQSYALVEDELERRRRDLDDVMAALGDMRRHLVRAAGHTDMERADEEIGRARTSWNRALETATSSIPATRLGFDTLVVRTALMETPLRRRALGYARDQVRRLLETSAAQLARLENQLHLTNAENERLRTLFLEQITEPSPEAPPANGTQSRADVRALRLSGASPPVDG
ncbi:MAG TPA: hypothetical protein VMZ22_13585 [Acidimicrobiales bacterium]|nr:hypothetical protein [Acidimicrobiales bacterium]